MRRPRSRTLSNAAPVFVVALVAAPIAAGCSSASQAKDRCEALATADIPRTTITATELVASAGAVGQHCLVDGFVVTGGDNGTDSNRANFEVGLPTEWNQDFYFQGVGGFAGKIGDLNTGLKRGYATASTDTGHQAASLDGSWALNNRAKQIDYGYRGVHVATIATKAVTRIYYGEDLRHALFNGCSNGGRQGLMEAQRYPEDYDAVIAESPALAVVDMIISWIWQAQALLREPGAWLSPEDLSALSAATLAQNDLRDGLAGGLISAPRQASFNPAKLLEKGALTPKQVKTVRAIYAGPEGPDGEQLAPGHPIGHEQGWIKWITGSAAPVAGPNGNLVFPASTAPAGYIAAQEFLRYFVFDDPDYNLMEFDFDTDLPKLKKLRPLVDASDPDLSKFAAGGGKLMITQGWADPALNALAAVHYYQDVVKTMGHRTTEDFFRLYMVPGMYHCGKGPGPNSFDALSAMEKWIRDGVAPNSLLATNHDSGHSRPLCAFPSRTVYRGQGSITNAANFHCTRAR